MNLHTPPEGEADAKILVVSHKPSNRAPVSAVTEQFINFCGIDKADCYFTTMFMCDTDPCTPFIETCTVWKDVEMALLKPKLGILVGPEATDYFLPDVGPFDSIVGCLQKGDRRLFGTIFLPIKEFDSKDPWIQTSWGIYATIIRNILNK